MQSRREIDVHDSADVRFAQQVVGSERVLHPGHWRAAFIEALGVKPVRVLGYAQATGELRGCVERRYPVFTHEARDRRVINARLLGQLALRQPSRLELDLQPLVE